MIWLHHHSPYTVGGVIFHPVTPTPCYTDVTDVTILFHSTQQSFRQPCVVSCSIKYSLCCECSVCNHMSDSQLQRSFRSSFTQSYRCLASRADEFCIHFSDFIPIRVFIRLTFLNYLDCSFFVIVYILFFLLNLYNKLSGHHMSVLLKGM